MPDLLGRLMVITDYHLQQKWQHSALAKMALQGGADIIQLREKHLSNEEIIAEVDNILVYKKEYQFALLINDHLKIAIQTKADGVHVGKEDVSYQECRNIYQKENNQMPILGVTIHSLEELQMLSPPYPSYIGVGPVFGTTSKVNSLPALGLEKLAEICQQSPVPVFAIGNLRPDRVADVIDAGAWGIAVLSAVCLADNPELATRQFAEALF